MKLQDYPCNRIILIARGWPNMPWFWDLVAMSSQIPLCLPNLVTQPFNQTLHKNLSNLNLHAWLLEPQQSRSRASLRQWQHELRLLKEDQPDPSMRQSGPFLGGLRVTNPPIRLMCPTSICPATFLCQLTCQSADIMSSLCGVGVRVRVNNFSSKTARPRDVLFFFKRYLIYRG